MSHIVLSLSVVKNPPKSFSGIIGHVKDTRDVFHYDVSLFVPFLDCKELHINVSRVCSRLMLVYHCNSCFIVFVVGSGLLLHKAKILQNRSQVYLAVFAA